MKENFILLGFVLLTCSAMSIAIYKDITKSYRNKERIGEQVILFGDTLTIEDYNELHEYYILSNGLIYECK
jgi:hypothetical protein